MIHVLTTALQMTTILTTPNILTASATEITLAALGLNTFLTMCSWNKMNPLYMLDTNIISDIFKPFPNQNVFIFSKLIDDIQANYPIIQYDNHAAWIQADICYRLEEKDTPIDFQDTQIAAIAVSNNMVLVTRNTKHFVPIQEVSPLMLENWFE